MLNRLLILSILIAAAIGPSAGVLAAEGSDDGQRPAIEESDGPRPDVVGGTAGELPVLEVAQKLLPEAQVNAGAGDMFCGLDWNTTTSDIGQGTNCLRARKNLLDLLRQQTACVHGICSEDLVVEVPCSEEQAGVWVVSGYLKYKCWIIF